MLSENSNIDPALLPILWCK